VPEQCQKPEVGDEFVFREVFWQNLRLANLVRVANWQHEV